MDESSSEVISRKYAWPSPGCHPRGCRVTVAAQAVVTNKMDNTHHRLTPTQPDRPPRVASVHRTLASTGPHPRLPHRGGGILGRNVFGMFFDELFDVINMIQHQTRLP